nr:MAC/perforin domain-containing protein [uncultured Pedobacter sp.]
MNKSLLIIALFILTLVSCSKETFVHLPSNEQVSDTITLIERTSKGPIYLSNKHLRSSFKLSNKSLMTTPLPNTTIDIRYYLGRAYNISVSEIGSPDGVKFPVIDVERLVADNPDYFLSKRIGESVANRFSFSTFDRYQQKANKTQTITGGFSLNFGLFTIGSKNKFVKTFSSDVINEDKRVYGELNVNIKDASHEILFSSNVFKKVKEDYLNATFLDELYNTSTKEFISNYGGFFITSFLSGGRANALFTGNYMLTSDTQTKENSMDLSINASFNFKKPADPTKPNGSSIDFGFGNSNSSTIARSHNIGDFNASVKTYGGGYGLSSFTVPKSVDDISIDLSNWANSMNDKTTHVLIDFNDNGLRPISDLINEENLRYSIDKLIQNNFYTVKPFLIEPCIEARWIRVNNTSGFLTIVLRTRFGDELVISDVKKYSQFNITKEQMLQFAREEAAKKIPYYKLAVKAVPLGSEFIDYHGGINYVNNITDISESTMQKYYDLKTKTTYLLSQSNGRKFAYSIHDDFILDTYGIRDWVNSMPSLTITKTELENYIQVAL